MSKIWSERLESNQRPRASETRALIQLSYAHTNWNRRPESNRHFFVRTEVSSPLDDTRTIWGDRRELNPRGQIHSLPPEPLGHGHNWCRGHESNVLVRLFRPARPYVETRATASLANLVEEEGIEPSFAGCRPAVLPLNDSPKT